ncbi:MAG TPA: hypothetical protein VFE02_11970 [Candidatus Acidoferrales bacterium]|nr:hypothetical protein [Candidatus Acidoferrales bacterium]
MQKPYVDNSFVGRDLLSLFSGDGRRIVAVVNVAYRAFLDESGTNPETPVLSVAGFYGTKDQWETFRSNWLPHSNGFHAKKSERLFPQLFNAINASKINGVLITISKENYYQYANAHQKTAIGNPYSVCAFLCILHICVKVQDSTTAFVLEEGQPNLGFVKEILEMFMATGRVRISAVASAKKTDFIELHAADFVSHIASAHETEWMQKLFDADRLEHGHVTKQLIAENSPRVTELFRQAKHARKKLKGNLMTKSEYENFDRTMRDIMKVPHTEIKAKLDAEKKTKKRKLKKTSASGHA